MHSLPPFIALCLHHDLPQSFPPSLPPPCPYFTVSLLLLTSSPLSLIFVFLNLLVSYSLSLSGTFDLLLFHPLSFSVCLCTPFPLKSLSSFLSLRCSNPLLHCHSAVRCRDSDLSLACGQVFKATVATTG